MDIVDEYGVGYGAKNIVLNPRDISNVSDDIAKSAEEIKNEYTKKEETTTPKYTNAETDEEKADKEQKELWAREDSIRKETQNREDNAYQRSVADMRKAGVNPNLQNISGAESGGGITEGTQKNLARVENAKNRELKLLIQDIQNNWAGKQADLDRITKTINTLIG